MYNIIFNISLCQVMTNQKNVLSIKNDMYMFL